MDDGIELVLYPVMSSTQKLLSISNVIWKMMVINFTVRGCWIMTIASIACDVQ